jgi:ATP-dependent Clp protease adaptor protein ClpS
MPYQEQISTEVLENTITEELNSPTFQLIVWNDEVNTFDWVIKALIEICKHDREQAEQCTIYIHFKGKYAVKEGDYDTLKTMRDGITDRGIGATVEEMTY